MRTVITTLLSSCARHQNLRLGTCLHASIIKNPQQNSMSEHHLQLSFNCLLNMYTKCGEIKAAVKLFDEMPVRDTVSWNSIISSFFKLGDLHSGFMYFKSLLKSRGVYRFDNASLTSTLSACGVIGWGTGVKMVHALVICEGCDEEVTVRNALITSYFSCRFFESGMRVFDGVVVRNVVTWTAAISGLAQNEFYGESLRVFVEMYNVSSCCMEAGAVFPNCLTYLSALSSCSGLPALEAGAQIHAVVWKLGMEADLCIESALMDMYSKCGRMEEAWRIFESAESLDEVSITVILAGFAQNGFEEQAIRVFVKMVKEDGAKIDPNMVSAVLGVFGGNNSGGTDIVSRGLGVQIHSLVIKKGFASNVFVGNGLINMYSKCGELGESVNVFNSMPIKNPVSYNSMIATFARHGDGLKALQYYEEMRSEAAGVKPTDVTFLSLLHACSHVGLVHKGMELLQSMEKDHGLRPRMEHYASIIDMLGRAGLLNEAKSFIEKVVLVLPHSKPDDHVLVWQSLLGACAICNDIEMGKYAAQRLAEVAPDSAVPYISMANIYSSKGRWNERATTIKRMRESGVAKETGISWIEIDKKIHSFVVGDQMMHTDPGRGRRDDVYDVVFKISGHMRDDDDDVVEENTHFY